MPCRVQVIRFAQFLVLAMATTAAGCAGQQPAAPPLAAQVTIYRDSFGIPHVFGETDAATTFGFGYAQAEDGFRRLEDNYIRALGRRSEVEGEAGFTDDWLNRLLRIPALARAEYGRMAPHDRELVDGFAAGINYWMAKHPQVKPRLLDHIEPWYPLALIRYLYFQNGFVYSAGVRQDELAGASHDSAFAAETGSNGFVIGPSRSATGHAMLVINPHLPYFGPGQVYEGHVHSTSGWNFTGYTRFGFPFPYVGHSDAIGWVSTDNAADMADLWTETFDDPHDPLAYRYGDGHRKAEQWSDTVLVRSDSGTDRRVVTLRRTHHGPLVAVRDGHPLAIGMAHLEDDGWLGEWYAMTRARSMTELRQAMQPLAMLFGNVMGADTAGHTWYLYNGAVPRRDPRFDWQEPVDGSDPATEWKGYHGIDELPELSDPASGWMQNNNTTPFLLTDRGNPDSTRYPPYMVTEGDNPRGVAVRHLLASTPSFTWDAWVHAAFDTRVTFADSVLPGTIAAVRRVGGGSAQRAAALDTLEHWDHRADTASVAVTLLARWGSRLGQLPEALSDQPAVQAAELDSVLAALERDWGTWQVPWGRVNRLQRIDDLDPKADFRDDRPSVAVPGVPGWLGAVFTVYTEPADGQRAGYGVAGGTYVSAVEFGPTVRAVAVHVFGASADPASPHFSDQAPLFARGEMRPSWIALAEIRAHLERAYRPGEEGR
jgi:penicillin amidase